MGMVDTTSGLSPRQLLRILLVGAETDSAEPDAAATRPVGEALRERLAHGLPLNPKKMDSLPAILGRMCQELAPLAERPLGDVLLDPTTDLGVIETLKEYGKNLSSRQATDAAHAVAVTLYFAAIASALVHHDAKITQYSYEHLAGSFEMLTKKDWMTPELGELFSQAWLACRGKRC